MIQVAKYFFLVVLFISQICNANDAKTLDFDVALSNLSVLSGVQQKAYLNIDIKALSSGFRSQRPKTNIAFVVDKSGSMSGNKLIQAKQALEMAISRLNNDDIAALIVYDNDAKVLFPATPMQNPKQLLKSINTIAASGSTALFAGVTQGSYEVKKFLDKNNVNRVILISDGMANIGPSKPYELAELGRALSQQNISVSTIGLGLGYNEDLMTQLAGHSDGSHYFVEDADKLAEVFDSELGDIFSVVAQDININIICKEGVKPLRILGRDEVFSGQNINTNFSQIYGNQQRHLTLELLLPAGVSGEKLDVADVSIVYNDSLIKQQQTHTDSVAITYTQEAEKVAEQVNRAIYDKVTALKVNEVSKQVIELRDQGDIEGAKKLQSSNIGFLSEQVSGSSAPEELKQQLKLEEALLNDLDDNENWNKTRKQARQKQYKIDTQQKQQDDDQNNY